MPVLSPPRRLAARPVRHRKLYAPHALQEEARKAAERAKAEGLTQDDIGARVMPPVKGAAISRALSETNEDGSPVYPGLLARILTALTDYEVTEEVRYRATRKG